jgi:transposase
MAKPLVSDELWELLQPLLPPPKPRRFRYPGRKPVGDRQALTGILFVLKTGIPWEDLPSELGGGCAMTCWRRLQRWQEQGVWFRLYQLLLTNLDEDGKIEGARAAVDSLFARAFGGVEDSGPNPTARGRPGVKQHILVDAQGLPLSGDVTPANVPESKELMPLVDSAGPLDEAGDPQHRPEKLYGDRAYDSEPQREELRKRGIEPHLAKRRTEHGSGLGVFRWVVERTNSWLHGFRKLRFVTEKTNPRKYAFFDLAMALICFRFLDLPEPQATPSFC